MYIVDVSECQSFYIQYKKLLIECLSKGSFGGIIHNSQQNGLFYAFCYKLSFSVADLLPFYHVGKFLMKIITHQ